MSRISLSSLRSTMSTAPITPPAAPMAPATRPSMPGLLPISTRIVREYWAEGEAIAGEDAIPRRSARGGSSPHRLAVAAVQADDGAVRGAECQRVGQPQMARAARVARRARAQRHDAVDHEPRPRDDAGVPGWR